MAWNKPSESGEAISRSLHKKSSLKRSGDRFSVKGAVTGAIIVLGAAVAAWWLWPTGETRQDATSTKRGLIKEVKPASAPKVAEVEVDKPKERPPQKVGEVRDGFIKLCTGELYPVRGVIKTSAKSNTVIDRTFTNFSDRVIAEMLTLEAGSYLLGSSEVLFEDFDSKFEKSLKQRIEFLPEDSPEVKELKSAVIELRDDLRKRKAAGEDIVQTLILTRNQLQELGTYKEELRQQIDKLMDDHEFSEKDEDDLVKAANLMLEDRGIKPFELPSAAKHALLLEHERETNE